jgi:hypothetical protein
MIDTIVLRVHDLKKHSDMVHFMNLNFKGTSKNTIQIDKTEYENIAKSPFMDEKHIIDYFRNDKTGTHLVRYKSQERLNNSGHYYFHAFENRDRNFLEFNFSIPKYKYGTNVLMLVQHFWDRDFQYHNCQLLDYNLKKSYDFLINFIGMFFKAEFIDCPVDYRCVEVNRIDLCYNQVFDSKRHALEYLEYQKQIRRKNSRTDSNSFREYETSLMYVTKRYSLKVYHKGTEYTKHDKKEHVRINNEKGREVFNIEGLQQFADKILRYEVTFRDTMLSYLYNHKIFRKRCTVHQTNYMLFKAVEAAKLKNDRIAVKNGTFSDVTQKHRFMTNNPYRLISKESNLVFKRMTKLLNRNREFILATTPQIDEFNTKTVGLTSFEPRALFSRSLFIECAIFFKAFVKEFQVTEKPSECAVSDRIDEYNSKNYYKLPKNEMVKFYVMLQKFSFEEIKKKGLYSKATFFRYKSRFEKIGITKNNVMAYDFINVPTDLSQYHSQIMFNKSLFKKN